MLGPSPRGLRFYNKSLAAIRFEIVARCPQTGARAGLLETPHGVVETPVFMPVGTQGSVKGLSPRDLIEQLDVWLLLANTYHLYLRPGPEVIRRLGGLHRFMGWPRALLTDSGGFQVFSLSGLRKVSEEGVLFRSHLDGDAHLFTPESTVDAQLAFGSDILMALDECLAYPVSHEAARESVGRTLAWARSAFRHYRERTRDQERPGALFPIVQGSVYADLRRSCAAAVAELEAEGYAIGGLSVGEPRSLSLEMVDVTTPLLPMERPRYVMGVGMPEELAQYVALGVDMMDCVLPSRNARNGCLFTRRGRLIIKQAQYKDDPRPIDEACPCYACRNFSRAYLRHLFQAGEMLYASLATLHNLRFYMDLMREIRQGILAGAFPACLEASRALAAAGERE